MRLRTVVVLSLPLWMLALAGPALAQGRDGWEPPRLADGRPEFAPDAVTRPHDSIA